MLFYGWESGYPPDYVSAERTGRDQAVVAIREINTTGRGSCDYLLVVSNAKKMVEITSIEQIEKEPYIEILWSGENREERLAPVFAFYQVELNINQEPTVFEAEVRDGGWGREKPYVTWDFEEKVYSVLTGKEYTEAHDFIAETIFRTFLGEKLQFPMRVDE